MRSLLIAPPLLDACVNWLWFGEVGFRRVWVTVLLTRVAIFVAVALVMGGAVFVAMTLAYRGRPVFLPSARPNDPIAPYRAHGDPSIAADRMRRRGSVGVLSGLIAQSNWVTVQLFLHGGSMGIADPEFGHDIGFFVFDLPFYRSVLNWLFVAVVLAFLASLATHYLFGEPAPDDRQGHAHGLRPHSAVHAGRHIHPAEGGRLLVRPLRPAVG